MTSTCIEIRIQFVALWHAFHSTLCASINNALSLDGYNKIDLVFIFEIHWLPLYDAKSVESLYECSAIKWLILNERRYVVHRSVKKEIDPMDYHVRCIETFEIVKF